MEHFRHEEQLIIRDIRNKFLWAIGIRYTLIPLGALFAYFAPLENIYLPFSWPLLIFATAYNLTAHLIYLIKKHYSFRQIIFLAGLFQFFDILAITFLIYITGWIESPYWFLYLVLIIVSGFGMFSYYSIGVFLIAFFCAFFYFGLLYSAYLRILPIYGPGFQMSPEELLISIYNKAVFTSIAFFLFAVTIYYFSKLLNQQREELSEKNTKLLVALSKIKAMDHLKDEFVSTASHELRMPLSIVRENMSLIEDGVVGQVDSQQKKLLETARLNMDRLVKILDNLLDLSKIESYSLKLYRETTDLIPVVRKAIEFLKAKAEHKNISIETKLPQKVMAWLDAEQILRVLVNLLDNAVKFTPDHGQITVGIEETNRYIEASICDNGRGIAKEDFPRVFERFVHLEKEGEALPRGAGLGLSICKGIIEMHSGKIWFESPPAGAEKGTKFTFSLPKA